MPIPAVIHQLWKTADVPARFTALRESWRRRNPDWEQRLWTDRDLDELVAERFPELLPIYRGYQQPICRADLGRYLVLETYGGVYADLDCECLAPLAPLLDGVEFLIGLEPDSHSSDPIVAQSGFSQLICPTFIASAPGHPFWRHVRGRLVEAARLEGPLNQTGPFMLTRALLEADGAAKVTVAQSGLLYPFDKFQCWDGSVFDLETWERGSRGAFATHYWDGGWFRGPTPLDGLPWNLPGQISPGTQAPHAYPEDRASIRISCLTAADGADLALAVESYRRQTHPNRELIIATPANVRTPLAGIDGATRDDIRLVSSGEAVNLSALLACAAAAATGDLLCRWNATELHDPRRLELQLTALGQTGAHASLLWRKVFWQPASRRMAVAAKAPDLGSLLCQKAFWPADMADSEAALRPLAATPRVSFIDLPRLTVAVARGGDPAFEQAWRSGVARFEGERCRAAAEELAKRLPMALADPPPPRPRRASRPGEILLLTPIKDGRARLPRYFELACRLESGGAPLSIAFLEGDSRDGSFEAIQDAIPSLEHRFERVELHRHSDGLVLEGPRWAPERQLVRRAAIARARNRLLAAALGDAEWVLWLDADLIDYPPDLALQLIAAGKDIVTPHCVLPSGRSFDLNTFLFSSGGGDPADLRDGLFQPPRGKGRRYLEDVADEDLVRVDAVGGTALLVRGDLHRAGLIFPEASYGGYIETEGLAMMARDRGVSAWALPKLIITHPDDAVAA